MSTSNLGAVLGSRGLASEVLRSKRGLSKTLIANLSSRFNVDRRLLAPAAARYDPGYRFTSRQPGR